MRLVKVKGESMYPFLRDDDFVVIMDIPSERLRRGNILVFKGKQKGYIIHRLVKKGKSNSIYLKGDGYDLSTESIEKNAVTGKAIGVIRAGRFIRFDRSKELISWSLSYLRGHYIRIRKKVRVIRHQMDSQES